MRPQSGLFLALVLAAAGFFAYNVERLTSYLRIGRPERRANQPGARLKNVLTIALGQSKLLREPAAGLMHALIFWGFCVLMAGTAELIAQAIYPRSLSAFFPARLQCILGLAGPPPCGWGPSANPDALLQSARMRSLLCWLSGQFDLIILDTPPVLAPRGCGDSGSAGRWRAARGGRGPERPARRATILWPVLSGIRARGGWAVVGASCWTAATSTAPIEGQAPHLTRLPYRSSICPAID